VIPSILTVPFSARHFDAFRTNPVLTCGISGNSTLRRQMTRNELFIAAIGNSWNNWSILNPNRYGSHLSKSLTQWAFQDMNARQCYPNEGLKLRVPWIRGSKLLQSLDIWLDIELCHIVSVYWPITCRVYPDSLNILLIQLISSCDMISFATVQAQRSIIHIEPPTWHTKRWKYSRNFVLASS